MCGRYTLEWLDSLISVSLNPEKTNLDAILPEQISLLKSKIEEEKMKQQSYLQNKVFSLLEENKISVLIRQYHCALVILLDQALENYKNIPANKSILQQLQNSAISCINELLFFIENRFSIYLGINKSVPGTYLSATRKEVKQKAHKIRIKLEKIEDKQLTYIVLHTLDSFSKSDKHHSLTFQEVSYVKELLKELEQLEIHLSEPEIFSTLDKLLIYLNFNSRPYLNHIIKRIGDKITAFENSIEKMSFLQFHFKELNQLVQKNEIALHPHQINLKQALWNWFNQEIIYLEEKLRLSTVRVKYKIENSTQRILIEKEKPKLLCILSTDQMAIILRALDELKVLKAKSMNEMFKTIVPYLSTAYKKELSYDSVRSKSYAAEERDIKIVIDILQQIIEKIKRY